MEYFICETCGVQYGLSEKAPPECTICNEERQYINPEGQTWTTLEEMLENGNWINAIHPEEEGLYSIRTTPKFAIGQTAYLAKAEGFNLLWDCVTYLDPATIEEIKAMGGVDAIALSHPHYYSTQVEWAEAFDAKIYIHEDDRRWVARMSERIVFWSGDRLELHEGVTLHRIGGHFKGAAIAHWQNGDSGKGVVFAGDIIRVVGDPKWVTFMYSYPNFIPLPSQTVRRIAAYMKGVPFNRMYDAFNRRIPNRAGEAVQKSADRYVAALEGTLFET